MTDLPPRTILQEIAAEIMLEHARDVEFLSIHEMTEDEDRLAGLDQDQTDQACRAIDELISKATVTITWPEGA